MKAPAGLYSAGPMGLPMGRSVVETVRWLADEGIATCQPNNGVPLCKPTGPKRPGNPNLRLLVNPRTQRVAEVVITVYDSPHVPMAKGEFEALVDRYKAALSAVYDEPWDGGHGLYRWSAGEVIVLMHRAMVDRGTLVKVRWTHQRLLDEGRER